MKTGRDEKREIQNNGYLGCKHDVYQWLFKFRILLNQNGYEKLGSRMRCTRSLKVLNVCILYIYSVVHSRLK